MKRLRKPKPRPIGWRSRFPETDAEAARYIREYYNVCDDETKAHECQYGDYMCSLAPKGPCVFDIAFKYKHVREPIDPNDPSQGTVPIMAGLLELP